MLSGYQLDLREIQRQNKITAQILQNYLEKRLFPNLQKTSNPPSVWDILPRSRRRPINILEVLNGTQTADRETLESGESEQVSSYYDDDGNNENEDYYEGMFYFCFD